jgi:hypothetical protein
MPNELKIVIDADVDGAIAGVNKFKKSVEGLTTGSIAQLEKAAMVLRTQLSNLSPAALNSSFGKDLVSSLSLVENKLKDVRTEAGLAGEKSINVFEHLNRQVKEFASLAPSLALGFAIGALSGVIEDFIKELFKGKIQLSEFAEASKEAFKKSGEESFKLEGLVSIARDVTASTKERKAAIDELQKTYPGYLQNISLENINSAATTKAINDLTEATFNKALADVFAAKGAAKQLEIFEKIQKIRSLADIKGSTKDQAVSDLASTGLKIENQKLDKLIEERDLLKQQFKDTQESFFDVFKKPPPKPEALQKALDDIISRARLFAKEFGNAFVVPNLEESFFKTKDDILKLSEKLLQDVKKGTLKIKLKTEVITDLDFIHEFAANTKKLTEDQIKELTNGFFEGLKIEHPVTVDVIPDFTLPNKDQQKNLDELLSGFSKLGTIGFKVFEKIDFSNFQEGLVEGNKALKNMLATAEVLNQAIGQGLSSAFNSVFDAILEGKSVFKALGNAIKGLVVETIKAVAQMLILKAVTNLIFPGAGGAAAGLGKLIGGAIGHQANFGLEGAIGNRAFNNVIQITGGARIAGNDIVLSYNRTNNSNIRNG